MASQLNYYDILGVGTSASADEIQRAYDAKMAVLAPRMIGGAPSKVIAMVDRARAALELARRTLSEPASQHLYDLDSGVLSVGGGLARPVAVPAEGSSRASDDNFWCPDLDALTEYLGMVADWLAPRPSAVRRVIVPDTRGLFVDPARRLMSLSGLHTDVVQLTQDPMPVEGLVVDQSPRAAARVRRMSAVTLQVWHPSQPVVTRD